MSKKQTWLRISSIIPRKSKWASFQKPVLTGKIRYKSTEENNWRNIYLNLLRKSLKFILSNLKLAFFEILLGNSFVLDFYNKRIFSSTGMINTLQNTGVCPGFLSRVLFLWILLLFLWILMLFLWIIFMFVKKLHAINYWIEMKHN